MKNLVKNGENLLLTVITLCAMYFLGHVLVGFFDYITAIWQDESLGFLAMAAPAIPALKKQIPVTIEPYTSASGRKYKALYYGSEGKLDKAVWYLCLHSDNRATSMFAFGGYNKERKQTALLLKPEFASKDDAQIIADFRAFLRTGLTEELVEKANNLKTDKPAKEKKGSANVGIAAAKIEALKDLFKEGLIDADTLAAKIASI